jgi:hypothetical protein
MSDAAKAVSAAALKSGDNKTVELTVASLSAGKTYGILHKGNAQGQKRRYRRELCKQARKQHPFVKAEFKEEPNYAYYRYNAYFA